MSNTIRVPENVDSRLIEQVLHALSAPETRFQCVIDLDGDRIVAIAPIQRSEDGDFLSTKSGKSTSLFRNSEWSEVVGTVKLGGAQRSVKASLNVYA